MPSRYSPTTMDAQIRGGTLKIQDAFTGQPLLPRPASPPRGGR